MSLIEFSGGNIEGEITPPPSKSCTHRAIIISSLTLGECIIHNPLNSLDIKSTIEAVKQFGAKVEVEKNKIIVFTEKLKAPKKTIDVGNSGTTLRFMTGVASMFNSTVELTGDDSIKKRPMGALIEALSRCNVECTSNNGCPPISVRGPVNKSIIEIDGSVSSQFISSLILSAPLAHTPIEVIVTGKSVSKPYINLTIEIMKKFGVSVLTTMDGYKIFPQKYIPNEYYVPSDFSSAAFPLVAAALGGSAIVKNVNVNSGQGDSKIIDILKKVGCQIITKGDDVVCISTGKLKSIDIDMNEIPDLFPIVCVLLSTAEGESRLYGAPHLRYKESDRISMTEKMLNSLGANIVDTEDGCIIHGVSRLKGGHIEHSGDHRIMMSAAVASLVSEQPVTMENDGCWDISFPQFPNEMKKIGLRCNYVSSGKQT